MATAKLTPADHIKTLNLLEAHGSVTNAARKLGIPRGTMDARVQSARTWKAAHAPKVETAPDVVEVLRSKPRVRMQVASPTGNGYRVLAIGDAHDDPHIPKDRFRWFGRHAAAMKADYVVQIGDWATLDSLNSHIPNETLQAKQKSPFFDDLISLNDSVREFENGLGFYECKKVITLGNHERRAWLFEDQNPESAGLLTGPLLSTFHAKGWETHDYGTIFYLGGVGFVHAALNRLGKTYGGKNAENTIANDAVHDIVIGHSHVARQIRQPKLGPYNHVTVLNLGCALPDGHVEDYARDSLSGWTWGVYELFIRGGHIESAKFVSMLELEQLYA